MRIDITGKKFGRLTAIKRLPTKVSKSGKKYSAWLCKCDCGKLVEARLTNLTQGTKKSCGCLIRDSHYKQCRELGRSRLTHGDANGKSHLYGVWCAMKRRCYNSHSAYYDIYGGRGISVCSDWIKYEPFRDWAKLSGYRQGLTLDRIDCNKNYEPSNCRWITIKDQQRNRRNNRHYKYRNKLYTVNEIADMVGLKPRTIQGRIERGWIIEDVVETPKLKGNGRYYRN